MEKIRISFEKKFWQANINAIRLFFFHFQSAKECSGQAESTATAAAATTRRKCTSINSKVLFQSKSLNRNSSLDQFHNVRVGRTSWIPKKLLLNVN